MDSDILQRAVALRRRLHECPELSGREARTIEAIEDFLRRNTALTVGRMDGWLLAVHSEGEGLPGIALRADMDAIPGAGGCPRHGCGHDGHCAILCALALAVEGRRFGKNLYFIFQPAEETGEGARRVCEGWPGLSGVGRIYGLHNIPGHPLGALLARPGCFACASEGFIAEVVGRPAHAAYPEDGANPAALLCGAALAIPGMIEDILGGDDRLLMHTVVGLTVGGENFGLSASEGKLCLTLRGHRRADIDALASRVEAYVREGCAAGGMACRFETRDAFPDTTNPPEIVAACAAKWRAAGLPVRILEEPMRWSEDFGEYLKKVPGMFFGVGVGEGCPGLHTAEYRFDDRAIEPAVEAFMELLSGNLQNNGR